MGGEVEVSKTSEHCHRTEEVSKFFKVSLNFFPLAPHAKKSVTGNGSVRLCCLMSSDVVDILGAS